MIILFSLNFIIPLIATSLVFIRPIKLSNSLIFLSSLILVISNAIMLVNHTDESHTIVIANILDHYQLAFTINPLAIIFALMVSILYCATNLYSFCYLLAQDRSNLGKDLKPNTHFFFTPIAIFSTLAIGYSSNLITLFIFYEILTFSTYPLVIQSFSDHARSAGRNYVTMLFCSSSVFIIFALIFLEKYHGGSNFIEGGIFNDDSSIKEVTLLLICFIFGFSKSAIFPLHGWLPKAMVAPIPVSALLHAVAVVKAGIFALIKVFVYLFGIDYLKYVHQISPWSIDWITLLSCFTIIYAGIMACKQEGIKKILAYSTISQLSYIILALSFITEASVIAAFIQMLSHSIAKITLFFSAGIIYIALYKTKVSEVNGIFKKLPIPVVLFILSSLSIIGLPFSIGYLTIHNLYSSIPHNSIGIIAISSLTISSILSCYYFAKVIFQMLSPAIENDIKVYCHKTGFLSLITATVFSLSLLLVFYLKDVIEIISTVFSKNIFT